MLQIAIANWIRNSFQKRSQLQPDAFACAELTIIISMGKNVFQNVAHSRGLFASSHLIF